MRRAITTAVLLPVLVALISATLRAQVAASDPSPRPDATPPAAVNPEARASEAQPVRDVNRAAGIHPASLLLQAHVDANHGQVCKLAELVCDRSVGILQYAVLDAGPHADKDDRMVSVPIDVLKVEPDTVHASLVVFDPNALATAPRFPADRWPKETDREWVARVWRHFNHKPYWEDLPGIGAAAAEKHAFTTLRLSRLLGTSIVNVRGTKLGQIEDFAVDMKRGTVLYVIVTPAEPARTDAQSAVLARISPPPSDQRVAVPWWALDKDISSPRLVLDMNLERLLKAPTFASDHWPALSTSSWAAADEAFFAVTAVKLPKPKPGH